MNNQVSNTFIESSDIIENNPFSDVLTENQQRLSDELEDIIYFKKPSPDNGSHNHVDDLNDPRVVMLKEFLRKNEHDEDLRYVLNLKRGEFQSTILHDIGSPSTGINYYSFAAESDCIEMLLKAGADINIKNGEFKTPLEVAIENKCYHLTEFLLNERQKELKRELDNLLEHANFWILSNEYEKDQEYYNDYESVADVKKFLDAHKDNKDLELILNLQTGSFGSTILHDIVKCDDEVVNLLLKAGANPNIQDTEGKTPLHYAAEYSCWEKIVILLENKANPNVVDELGNTPLRYAIATGDNHTVEPFLTINDASINLRHKETGETPIFDAVEAERDSGRIVELMIASGKVDLTVKNERNMSVLHKAALNSRSSTVKLLLKHGANPFDKDILGCTPLHFAALNNLKIENNSNTEYRENVFDYRTIENLDANITAIIGALVEAQMQRIEEQKIKDANLQEKKLAIDLEIEKEKYVNARDKNGNTPLFYAIESGKVDVVNQLFLEGAKVDVANKEGFTPFHFAIKNKNINLIEALLPKRTVSDKEGTPVQRVDFSEAKRLLQLKDKKGNTLLHHAVKWGCDEKILDFLVEHGVDINALNKNRVAPIHIAAKYGSYSQLKFFIDKKADLNLRCGNLSSYTIEDIGKERELVDDSLETYISIQNDNLGAGSTVEMRSDIQHKKAPPISILVSESNSTGTNMLLDAGAKTNIEYGRNWSPLHIAIRRASEDCNEAEKENRLKIVKDLASVSDLEFLVSEGINKWPKTWRSEKIIQILQNAVESRNGGKLSNDSLDDAEASTPIFDDFYSNIGVHVIEPDLFSGLSDELNKSCEAVVWGKLDDWNYSVWSSNRLRDSDFELPQSQKEKLDRFLFKIYGAGSIAELDNIVDDALKDGVRINSAGIHHQVFTTEVVHRADFLMTEKKEGDETVVNIICKLISKGGCITDENRLSKLENVLRNYKENIAKAEQEFKEYCDNLKKIAEEAASDKGSVEELKVDNTTFCLKFSKSSLVNIAKLAEGAKKLGFKEGNVAFGQNIVKIGESEVSVVIENGIRNYTDLSDNSDITLTFYPNSKKELRVRLHADANDRGKVIVEVLDQKIFKELKESGEKIGENCRLGGLSVYEAIEQKHFYGLSNVDSKKAVSKSSSVRGADWLVKTPNQNSQWAGLVSAGDGKNTIKNSNAVSGVGSPVKTPSQDSQWADFVSARRKSVEGQSYRIN